MTSSRDRALGHASLPFASATASPCPGSGCAQDPEVAPCADGSPGLRTGSARRPHRPPPGRRERPLIPTAVTRRSRCAASVEAPHVRLTRGATNTSSLMGPSSSRLVTSAWRVSWSPRAPRGAAPGRSGGRPPARASDRAGRSAPPSRADGGAQHVDLAVGRAGPCQQGQVGRDQHVAAKAVRMHERVEQADSTGNAVAARTPGRRPADRGRRCPPRRGRSGRWRSPCCCGRRTSRTVRAVADPHQPLPAGRGGVEARDDPGLPGMVQPHLMRLVSSHPRRMRRAPPSRRRRVWKRRSASRMKAKSSASVGASGAGGTTSDGAAGRTARRSRAPCVRRRRAGPSPAIVGESEEAPGQLPGAFVHVRVATARDLTAR